MTNPSSTFIIFGATGDLTKRKLIPALYQLVADKKIDNFAVIGAAIEETTIEAMLAPAKQFIPHCDEHIWRSIVERTVYQRLNFTNPDDFTQLKQVIEATENNFNLAGNRVFYLATAAHFFCTITEHIGASGLATRTAQNAQPWHRLVYEKPFGHDLQSAHAINACIDRWFNEDQIYRVDHYLTKELVSNIALIRFTNCFFEPLWNNRYIESVQIILSETVGIEGRGAYYDAYGALRDMVQNHMLELMALIGMEAPKKLTGDFIRAERAKVLEKVRYIDGIFGQYVGYTHESAIPAQSTTETFVALALGIENERWHGVPFYLKTGKKLDAKKTVIHIKFKHIECLLTRGCPTESNWLTINIMPNASFSLSINAKKPGTSLEITPVTMDFCHSCIFGSQELQQAYTVLLEEIVRGENSISVRFDEIEYAWNVIDTIKTKNIPLYPYEQGSSGPAQLTEFEHKHAMRWKS